MNLAAFLSYLGNATTFPFWGGWVAPSGSNPQITVGGVVLDQLTAPAGDLWVRAYYRKIQGNACDVQGVDIWVTNYGQSGETAYLKGTSPKPKPKNILTLASMSTALGSPVVPLGCYAAIATAAGANPPNVAAAAFLPLLTPGTGVGIDFYDPATVVGIAVLVSQGVLTADQQAALAPLSVIVPTDFF